MRMRRKNNLDSRMADCGEYLISTEGEKLNAKEAVEDLAYLEYEKVFGNANKIELEIGCGKGQFICESAVLHPEINYIGVEKITNVLITACERVKREKLSNVKFICTNAAYLPRYIPPQSISKIYLNFSNPLPKKSEANLRLTNQKYLEIYKRFLVKNGWIYQKTDDMNFFEYSIEQLSESGFVLKNLSLDLHKGGAEGNIVTEHEMKFSKMGLPIYKLEAYLKE